jgi:hypothetical protein
MAKYRVLEIKDKLINNGKPFWRVEKKILGLFWSEYFEEHSEWGATFYEKDKAMVWYQYHLDANSRTRVKCIAEN